MSSSFLDTEISEIYSLDRQFVVRLRKLILLCDSVVNYRCICIVYSNRIITLVVKNNNLLIT